MKKITLFVILFTILTILLIGLFIGIFGSLNKKLTNDYRFNLKQDNRTSATTVTADLCVTTFCYALDGKNNQIYVSETLNGFQGISLLVHPLQVDSAGIVDFENGITIAVKDGQIVVNTPKPLLPFQKQPTATVYINGQKTATLFPYYWQQLTVTFDQPVSSNQQIFGNITNNHFKGFMETPKFYQEQLSADQVQKEFSNLMATSHI